MQVLIKNKNLSCTLSQSEAVLNDFFKKLGFTGYDEKDDTKPIKVVLRRIGQQVVSIQVLEDDNKGTDVSSEPIAELVKKPALDEAVTLVAALSERDRATLTLQLLNSIGAFKEDYDMNDVSHILVQSIGNGDFPRPSHLDE